LDSATRAWPWLTAIAITLVVAVVHLGLWAFVHRPAAAPDWSGDIAGFAFSAFQRDQSPFEYRFPTVAQIESDIVLLARYTSRIRSYASAENDAIPELAQKHQMDLMAGAWLDRRLDNNELEIDALASAAQRYASITRAVIGNEAILRSDLTPRQLMQYLDRARAKLRVPVSTAEPWHVWLKYPQLAEHVDFITVHLLPYWEGIPRRNAVAHVLLRYDELRARFPDKPIVIGEVGWPSNGDRFRNARASTSDEARFLREFFREADERKLDYYVMEAFDQPWKEAGEGRVGAYWGLFDAARQIKFPLTGEVSEDPSWELKALGATLLALLPMLLFVQHFRRFRLWGRVFFAGMIQAGSALLVWSFTLPMEFYLEPLDWAMLLVLVPAQVAILAILLIHGFEFVETLAQDGWRRRFGRVELAPDSVLPLVSIHLPCHNEPPEMVIQTLDSLAALDYPAFEVLVVDNNTRDSAVWAPVEAHCMRLGKAGALNFALQQTDPRAEVVAVIDSDYVVERRWLRDLVGHFSRPDVGIVQAPQAHRDWSDSLFRRICNWEYEGFFRIGMHHRNERDAIIQHGTMTMVRRSLLDSLGWAEWCICEDAELGLRVMQSGFRTVYVDEVFGRGVTPADFAAYKTQRFRWAFGAMQILRRHWSSFFMPAPLSRGQRYHFLTGWFSWFADALHLVFTLLAVIWTAGMLLMPGQFALPHALFMLPVIGFFVVKVLFGLVLYRARVPCSWFDALGAALASMALSHAIARGVLRGLVAREHPFARTAKRRRLTQHPSMFSAVREELLLLCLLLAAIAGVAAMPGREQTEGQLWSAILCAQSLPYFAAVLVAWLSARQDGQGAAAAKGG
jgi:exo-beta-1,3-glucanase (GH17 family)/cellulose synthase/poly-beta-1,6-N-acetylglucosamine synthase-like glycosyltransferase